MGFFLAGILLGAVLVGLLWMLGRPKQPPLRLSALTVVVEPMPAIKTGCDTVFWPVKFRLSAPSSSGGWIVQEIRINAESYDCNYPQEPPEVEAEIVFWEAWRIQPGNDVPEENHPFGPDADGDGWADDYFNDAYSHRVKNSRRRRGVLRGQGWLYFFEGSALPPSFKRPNRNTMAGRYLYSSEIQPSFWPQPAFPPPTEHSMVMRWTCCALNEGIELEMIPPPA